jgi:hypothetical protein
MNDTANDLDRTHNEIIGCDVSCAWLLPSATFDAPCC